MGKFEFCIIFNALLNNGSGFSRQKKQVMSVINEINFIQIPPENPKNSSSFVCYNPWSNGYSIVLFFFKV
jgi:hypothetical protein